MCRAHGIRIHVIPFDSAEWLRTDAWARHAWNSRNGGFLSERRDVLDSRAYSAAEARIDALIQAAGDVIGAWELCAEMTWMLNRGYWNTDAAGLRDVIDDTAVPWVEHLAQYVKANHTAPVGNGHVFAPKGFSAELAYRNEVYRTPSLDFAMINWYGDRPLSDKVRQLRAAQQYTGKPIYVEQYAPWDLGGGAAYTREPSTFDWSKAHEWAAACGEYGLTGPQRWPEIRPAGQVDQWWGVAHKNLAEIAGVTWEMAQHLDLSGWSGRGQAWDSQINVPWCSSWGDGRYVTAFVRLSGAQQVTVSGLSGTQCSVRGYDYVDGNAAPVQFVPITGGQAVFPVRPRNGYAVFLIEPQGTTPPDPTPTRTLFVRATLQRDGQSSGTFEGALTEV
jgi:hypothetical protein